MSTLTQTGVAIRRPGWAPWALVLLLHLLLWWSWRQATGLVPQAFTGPQNPPMVWLRRPALPPQPPPATPAAADAGARRTADDQTRRRASAAPAAPSRATRAVPAQTPDRTPAVPPVAPPALAAGQVPGRAPAQTSEPTQVQPEAAASSGVRTALGADGAVPVPEAVGHGASAPPRPLLLDTPATRQALRQMARQPLLAERAADSTGIAVSSGAERRTQAASAAGKGDCIKGEYFGAGAGLLSAPFLLVAAARGQCSSH